MSREWLELASGALYRDLDLGPVTVQKLFCRRVSQCQLKETIADPGGTFPVLRQAGDATPPQGRKAITEYLSLTRARSITLQNWSRRVDVIPVSADRVTDEGVLVGKLVLAFAVGK